MLRSVLLGATALALIVPAVAGQNGFYAGIEGGASFVPTLDGFETVPALFFEKVDVDTGWAIFGTVGYEWGKWRFEGEVGYINNKMDQIAFHTGFVSTDVDDLSQLTLMANTIYDLPISPNLSLALGGGIGLDRLSFKWPGFGQPGGVEGDDWALAYQGIAGLNYALSDSMDVFANYRFLYVSEFEFTDRINRQHFEDVHTHTLSAGLRYSFGVQ